MILGPEPGSVLPLRPSLCDLIANTTKRVDDLDLVFNDVFKVTKDAFNITDILSAKKALDLGMGRGGVGGLLKKINPYVHLTGVDDVLDYQGGDLYQLYNQRIQGNLAEDKIWSALSDIRDMDLVVGVGLPPYVIEYLAKNFEKVKRLMSKTGVCIFVSDFNYNEPEKITPFIKFKGNAYIDNTILLSRGK